MKIRAQAHDEPIHLRWYFWVDGDQHLHHWPLYPLRLWEHVNAGTTAMRNHEAYVMRRRDGS